MKDPMVPVYAPGDWNGTRKPLLWAHPALLPYIQWRGSGDNPQPVLSGAAVSTDKATGECVVTPYQPHYG